MPGGAGAMDAKTKAEAARLLKVDQVADLTTGGQKTVARCRAEDGSPAILKLIEIDSTPSDTLERAHREVELLRTIDHPNVVKALTPLVEVGSPPKAVAWLEEVLVGEDLRTLVGPALVWTWDDTQLMALDVANGLSALHAARVVHRDLSPGNVFRRDDGSYAVIDPGFGRHLERSTLTGVFQPGTPGFMSPEHAGSRVIPASDVFAVGILMYLALTGELPVPVSGWPNPYLTDLRDKQAASVALTRNDLDSRQAEVVDRCLHRHSGRRYLDGAELVEALEAL